MSLLSGPLSGGGLNKTPGACSAGPSHPGNISISATGFAFGSLIDLPHEQQTLSEFLFIIKKVNHVRIGLGKPVFLQLKCYAMGKRRILTDKTDRRTL